MHTAVHVTHEAIDKIGGIGAVLAGLLTSRVYLSAVPRNVLVGPYWGGAHDARLGAGGEVLHSSLDGIEASPHTDAFREIQGRFGVGIIFGSRTFTDRDTGVTSTAETLLIDVRNAHAGPVDQFKGELFEHFGIESLQYQHIDDFEQWVRLAKPAIAGLAALGVGIPGSKPAVVLSHEYMGMPTALAAILEQSRGGTLRTIFYAHEVAPVRRIVEAAPGHDTMFYNVLRHALASGKTVDDVFGSQDDYYKTPLVKATRFCDGVFAVGDEVLRELKFLGKDVAAVNSRLAYNGVPSFPIDAKSREKSRELLQTYSQTLLGWRPDFVFSHVTRLVPSKGLWRDLRVMEALEPRLRQKNETAVLFVLSTEGPKRASEDVRRMEADFRWPIAHREGSSDLTGGEANYYALVQAFNSRCRNAKVVFLNQFGFDAAALGDNLPIDATFMDLRKGSDVEFGQSIYEPFGIAQVEPISFGGLCVFTGLCGCAGFVAKAAGGETPNVIVADYTDAGGLGESMLTSLLIGRSEREAVETRVAEAVAAKIDARLPRDASAVTAAIERGQALASRMSWDVVARDYVVPGLDAAVKRKPRGKLAGMIRSIALVVGLLACNIFAGPATKPSVVGRSEWGSVPGEFAESYRHSPKIVLVHHEGVLWKPGTDPIKRLQGLQRFSKVEKKWPDVPYHFHIAPDGRIFEGRDMAYKPDTNTKFETAGYVNIELFGNFEVQRVTEAQLRSLVQLTAWLSDQIDMPTDKLVTHMDVAPGQTDCPGKDLYRYFKGGQIATWITATRAGNAPQIDLLPAATSGPTTMAGE